MNYVYTDQPISQAAQHIAAIITARLNDGQRVLWLLSGGSSTQVAIEAARLINGLDLSNLYVTMTDERYVAIGHADENWQQLIDGGFWLEGANLYRPLTGDPANLTAKNFGDWLDQQLTDADYRLAIFGIGTDGHTAGIKPGSTAITSNQPVDEFISDDFHRLTMTFPSIKRLDEAIIQISGDEKRPILEKLLQNKATVKNMPAIVLHQVPKVSVYTDINL